MVAYWTELGRFMHEFSRVEALLVNLLRHYSGVTDAVGGAVLNGFRADAAKDAINRVLEATGRADAAKRLAPAFSHLSIIAGMRNKIVHWGATHQGDDEFLVTNAKLNPSKSRLTEIRITTGDLHAMSLDLYKIGIHFILEVRFERAQPTQTLSEVIAVLEDAWLYKPPQQAPSKNGTRARRRERQNRPPASPR